MVLTGFYQPAKTGLVLTTATLTLSVLLLFSLSQVVVIISTQGEAVITSGVLRGGTQQPAPRFISLKASHYLELGVGYKI